MRRCPIIKQLLVLITVLLLFSSQAQAAIDKNTAAQGAGNVVGTAVSAGGAAAANTAAAAGTKLVTDEMVKQALIGMNSMSTGGAIGALPEAVGAVKAEEKAPVVNFGALGDPDSIIFKANALSEQRKQELLLKKNAGIFATDEFMGEMQTPPAMQDLQAISEEKVKDNLNSTDAFLEGEISKDMRFEAMKNAALSYGARGGLSKRSYEIMEKMDDYAQVLDKVFDFRSLLIKAPSGMMIEPPIIRESLEALVIKEGGKEAAVADSIFDINKNARIVSAPRDWRQYLIQKWSSKVPPPPKVLWPKTEEDKANWNMWVSQGWDAGVKQAEQIFEMNTDKLASDYKGMVRYRILLAQGMVSAPFTTHEERGVVGDRNQMRIGDRAIKITEPSRFLTGADIWRPADR